MNIAKVLLSLAALALLTALLIAACGDGDAGLSRAEVEEVVQAELADAPAPEPGLTSADVEEAIRRAMADMPQPESGLSENEVEEIVKAAVAAIPDPQAGLTTADVEEAIRGALAALPQPESGLSENEVAEIVEAAIAAIPDPQAGLTTADVEKAIRSAMAALPQPAPGLTAAEAKSIARGVVASVPPRSAPAEYTRFFVDNAISMYETQGLDATLAYYNRPESTDGQWYVFIADENKIIVAHAAVPGLVGKHASQALGPNSYPAGSALAASATESGAWFDYTYANPASGAVEIKHSWVIIHDGLIFGSGWYEPGPSKSDAPSYTKAFVQQAAKLYDAVGQEETLAYYNREESIDGQWYVYIIDENDLVIGHPDANRLGLDVKGWVGTDANGYNFGPEMLSATGEGKWVSYVYRNPESGGLGIDFDHLELKNVWVVRHDGLLFASGWYIDADEFTKSLVATAARVFREVGLEGTIAYFASPEIAFGGLAAVIAYYNSAENVEGNWSAFIADESGTIIDHYDKAMVGRALSDILGTDTFEATAEGNWVTTEDVRVWVLGQDGMTFGSGWHSGHDESN